MLIGFSLTRPFGCSSCPISLSNVQPKFNYNSKIFNYSIYIVQVLKLYLLNVNFSSWFNPNHTPEIKSLRKYQIRCQFTVVNLTNLTFQFVANFSKNNFVQSIQFFNKEINLFCLMKMILIFYGAARERMPQFLWEGGTHPSRGFGVRARGPPD